MRSCVYLHCIAGGLRTLSGEGMFENLFYARSKKVLFPNKIFRSDSKRPLRAACICPQGASIYDVSAVDGGPKSRQNEQDQMICDSDRGGSKNPKILRT